MGVAIVGSYILLAALVGPSIEAFGVPAIAAHFFILYMITSGFFTPPLCPAAFVAASIAIASPFRIGFIAMRLGIIAFLVPFIIIYSPALILIGSPAEIVVAAITAFIGVFALSVGFEGYLFGKTQWFHRVLLIGSGIVLVVPDPLTDLIGLILLTGTLAQHWFEARKSRLPIRDH
jgi:TRAP-type uncharacterized transport system fused permease subunit